MPTSHPDKNRHKYCLIHKSGEQIFNAVVAYAVAPRRIEKADVVAVTTLMKI
jgi:hypothetical protein